MNYRVRHQVTRFLYVLDRAWEQLLGWRHLGVRRRDLVLDVGSGGQPFLRADVLCDRFLFDNVERQRSESLVVDRPLVIADASRLPFRDEVFGFSRSSHLLEHLDDPEGHLMELQRVSRRGIIITPSEVWERLYPISAHRWVVNRDGSRLRLKEKVSAMFDPSLARIFDTGLAPYGRYGFSYFWNYYRGIFEVHYAWEGKIEFQVERLEDGRGRPDLSAATDRDGADGVDGLDSPAKRRLKILASRVVRRLASAHYHVDLWALLVCPACHGDFRREPEVVECHGCARRYRVHDGRVPILLL